MNSTTGTLKKILFLVCLFGFLPLWNLPHTIAARYLFAGLLLIIVVTSNPNWKDFFRANKVLLVFFAYLIIHLIFFSTDTRLALNNFLTWWLKVILFSLLGAGAGLLISKDDPRKLMLNLGIAFSIPLLIHLGLALYEGLKRAAFPWGYWGINETHGDLGYTALHATILLSVFFLYQAKSRVEKALALVLLFACIASPLIASGRGGTAFVLLSLVFVSVASLAVKFNDRMTIGRQLLGLSAILLVSFAVIRIGIMADPDRWNGVIQRVQIGLTGDALKVSCEGVGVLRQTLEDEGQTITPEISRVLQSISEGDGDGVRVLTARAALRLSWANPMGIDQSRTGYQIALSKYCNPTIRLANAHDGWIDTALAIGIPGAFLYFLVLLNFARLGLRSVKLDEFNRPYAMALFALSTIWIVRSLFDSSQRDHMLEMQVFTIAFLYGFIVSNKRPGGTLPTQEPPA